MDYNIKRNKGMRFKRYLEEKTYYDAVFNPFMTKTLLLRRMHNPEVVRKKYKFSKKEWDNMLEILAACLNWKRFGGKRSTPKILKEQRKNIPNMFLKGGNFYRGEFYRDRKRIELIKTGKSNATLSAYTSWTKSRDTALKFAKNEFETGGKAKRGWGIIYKVKIPDNLVLIQVDRYLKSEPIKSIRTKELNETVQSKQQEIVVETKGMKLTEDDVDVIINPSGKIVK